MTPIKKIVLFIAIIIIYYLVILLIYYSNPSDNVLSFQVPFENDGNTKLNVQDQVSISVQRNRFYGTITESNGESYVDLLNIIILPLKKNNINFVTFHIIFTIFLSILIFLSVLKKSEGGE